jgi:hypothetical protein
MAKLRTLSEAIQRLAAAAQASAGPSSETAA